MNSLFNRGKVKIELNALGLYTVFVENTKVGFIQSLSLDLNAEDGIQDLTIAFLDPDKCDDVKIKQSIQENVDLVNSAEWPVVKFI